MSNQDKHSLRLPQNWHLIILKTQDSVRVELKKVLSYTVIYGKTFFLAGRKDEMEKRRN